MSIKVHSVWLAQTTVTHERTGSASLSLHTSVGQFSREVGELTAGTFKDCQSVARHAGCELIIGYGLRDRVAELIEGQS